MALNETSSQHAAWSEGAAANEWFRRNAAVLDPQTLDNKSIRLFSGHLRCGERLLEIGCANGYQSERLRTLCQCEVWGLDPSTEAIAQGSARFPQLKLSVGTADRLPFADGHFNAVLFGFCLYLVDRRLLPQVVAEADRVLAPGGRLMITDFDPPQAHRRPFKHQAGLWSYKMQYPQLWLASPAYALAEKVAFSHEGQEFHSDPSKRVASWVLVKQPEDTLPVAE